MGYCSKCAAELDNDASFCHKCGTPVKKETGSSEIESDIYKTSLKKELVYGKVDLEDIEKGYEIDGRYIVEEKIGQGGFGAVYKVNDKSLGTKKALKVLPSTIVNDREAMEVLRSEASTMAKLNHPNIVRIYDFHESGKIKYIDMEFVDGKNLTDMKLDSFEKRLNENEVKKHAEQIAKGLLYAHSKNVIHKDIKPQNILVSKENEIKIMDFGISETVRTSMSRLDNTGTSGTLVYMSPEQIIGENVGKESDIYSYGALLYELLTGTPPFTRGAIEHQILNKEPEDIKGASKALNSIIIKCLKKDYKDRFKNFDEVLKALNGEKDISEFENRFSAPDSNKELSNEGERKNKILPIAASILLILAVGFGLYFFTGNKFKKTALKPVKSTSQDGEKSKVILNKKALKRSKVEEVKEKISFLNSEIEEMKKRIDSGKGKDGDSLENIYELVNQKSDLAEKLVVLKKAEKERKINLIKEDIKRYKRVVESKEGKSLENAAWQSLIKKYPGRCVGVVKGDTKALLNGARLYIKAEPENAEIKILNINHRYFSGIKLSRGKYTISVKAEGYSGKNINIDIDSEKEIHKKISLVPFSKVYIKPRPENARITIMGTEDKYFPGMMLEPKEYTIKVSAKDYEEKVFKINPKPGKTLNKNVELLAFGTLTVISDPPGADIKILNTKEKYHDEIKLKKGNYKLSITRKDYFPINKAIYLKSGEKKKEVIKLNRMRFINSAGMKFIYIKPGTFMMGSPSSESGRYNDEKQHKVTLIKGYFMQTTEVTQGQWKKIMGNNPSRFKKCGDNCPVESVSWSDAKKFIKKLNKMDKNYKYSLPTEAQWEYAARAGSKGQYAGSSLSSMGWYSDNSGNSTHAVGKKKPNAWGLYDMHGNVYEWCEDWYKKYPSGHVTDPTGPGSGSSRVNRGGSWYDGARSCRSAYRGYYSPGNAHNGLGFRVVASQAVR